MIRAGSAWALALSGFLAIGCGGSDDTAAAEAPPSPTVTLVTGPPSFEKLADGDALKLIVGPQFGVMLQLGLRSVGLDPTKPRFAWKVVLDGETRTEIAFASPLRPMEGEEGQFELPPIPLLLDGVSPEGLEVYDGKDVVVEVGIQDTTGQTLDVHVSCLATH